MKRPFRIGQYLVVPRAGYFRIYSPTNQYLRHTQSAAAAIAFVRIMENRVTNEIRSRKGQGKLRNAG
jgi:hypothetical protein